MLISIKNLGETSIMALTTENEPKTFYIGEWFVDPATSRIRHGGQEAKLEPKVMAVLAYLAENAGQVVTREQVEQDIWSGMIVGYDSLTTTINKLRKSLNDDPKNPRYIETLSKRGYRLIAEVRPADNLENIISSGTGLNLQNKHIVRAGLIIFLLALAGLSYLFLIKNQADLYSEPDIPSIAVLPFRSIAQRTEQEYFTDGITEDLTTDLSKMSGLLVISRRSALIYKNREVDVRQVGKELNVRYVLQGSARAAGKRLRINAQLVDTETGVELWAERYDRKRDDVFSIQDELRGKIVSALSVALTNRERERLAARYTTSIDAYDRFLKAQSFLVRQTNQDNLIAKQLFQEAIDIDSGFARAHSGLALAYANDYRFGWNRDKNEIASLALATATRAVNLDNHSPQAAWVLGYVYLFVLSDHVNAIEMGKRTIDIDPNHADGHMLLAVTYVFSSEPDKSIALVQKAMRLNPFYPSQYPSVLALANLLNGKPELAIDSYLETLEINPYRIQPNVYLVAAYMRAGQPDNAKWQVEKLKADFPDFNLDDWAEHQPYRDKSSLTPILNDIRQAGL